MAFMPFPTSVISEYGGTSVGVSVYATWAPMLIGGLTLILCFCDPEQALIPLIASPLIVRGVSWIGNRVAARSQAIKP